MSKARKKTPKSETQNATPADETNSAKSKGSHGGKKIISIAVDPALAKRLTLCARAEGTSVTQLIVDAVSRNLKARIASALEALKAEVES